MYTIKAWGELDNPEGIILIFSAVAWEAQTALLSDPGFCTNRTFPQSQVPLGDGSRLLS